MEEKRMIDAKSFAEHLERMARTACPNLLPGLLEAAEYAKDFITDVAQVRNGRWICIRKGYGEYECSVCHGVDSDCSDYYGTHVVTEQDYCPYCGAKMDGVYDG